MDCLLKPSLRTRPQDPTYEPATALMDRIRLERRNIGSKPNARGNRLS